MWKTLSSIHEQKLQERSTGHISVNGMSFVKIVILVRQVHQSQKARNPYLRFTKKDQATQSSTPQGACSP